MQCQSIFYCISLDDGKTDSPAVLSPVIFIDFVNLEFGNFHSCFFSVIIYTMRRGLHRVYKIKT